MLLSSSVILYIGIISPETLDKNLDIDSTNITMTIDENNEYTSAFIPNKCTFAPNYIYTSYELEFYPENKFEIRTSLGLTNTGTYSVRKGFIFCTYETNDYTVEIPYTIDASGEIELDAADAFDINE